MSVEERIPHLVRAAPRQRESNSENRFNGSDSRFRTYSANEFKMIRELRELAGAGRLAAIASTAVPARRQALSGAAFAVAWPVVFVRLTCGLERGRGHLACASSVFRMAQECLDRFYDDVEAAVFDVLMHAAVPIANLEAWIASRLNAATVDGHRRRRGERGALQRPRLPKWLSAALDDNPWLNELAIQILLWVGVTSTAGAQLYPLDAWALRRGAVTGDLSGSDVAAVARDLETVLAAMRSRPEWHATYVDRPLGHKQAPICSSDAGPDMSPLLLTDRHDADEAHLAQMASVALCAIERHLDDTDDPAGAVSEVIRSVFLTDTGGCDLDRPPLSTPNYERRVNVVLGDPDRVDAVVAVVLRILDRPVTAASRADASVTGQRP